MATTMVGFGGMIASWVNRRPGLQSPCRLSMLRAIPGRCVGLTWSWPGGNGVAKPWLSMVVCRFCPVPTLPDLSGNC